MALQAVHSSTRCKSSMIRSTSIACAGSGADSRTTTASAAAPAAALRSRCLHSCHRPSFAACCAGDALLAAGAGLSCMPGCAAACRRGRAAPEAVGCPRAAAAAGRVHLAALMCLGTGLCRNAQRHGRLDSTAGCIADIIEIRRPARRVAQALDGLDGLRRSVTAKSSVRNLLQTRFTLPSRQLLWINLHCPRGPAWTSDRGTYPTSDQPERICTPQKQSKLPLRSVPSASRCTGLDVVPDRVLLGRHRSVRRATL